MDKLYSVTGQKQQHYPVLTKLLKLTEQTYACNEGVCISGPRGLIYWCVAVWGCRPENAPKLAEYLARAADVCEALGRDEQVYHHILVSLSNVLASSPSPFAESTHG